MPSAVASVSSLAKNPLIERCSTKPRSGCAMPLGLGATKQANEHEIIDPTMAECEAHIVVAEPGRGTQKG